MVTLGSRFHIFSQPSQREAMRAFCVEVLECNVIERKFDGMEYPVMVVLADQGVFSVEFRSDAPDPSAPSYGAWIEFVVPDREAMQQRLRDAGTSEFKHAGSTHTYFRMPNGQVFRVLTQDQLNAP